MKGFVITGGFGIVNASLTGNLILDVMPDPIGHLNSHMIAHISWWKSLRTVDFSLDLEIIC